jgi:hypothetical protein
MKHKLPDFIWGRVHSAPRAAGWDRQEPGNSREKVLAHFLLGLTSRGGCQENSLAILLLLPGPDRGQCRGVCHPGHTGALLPGRPGVKLVFPDSPVSGGPSLPGSRTGAGPISDGSRRAAFLSARPGGHHPDLRGPERRFTKLRQEPGIKDNSGSGRRTGRNP